MRSPLALVSSAIDRFLPPGGDPIEQLRGRFFVVGSWAITAAIAGALVMYAMSPSVGQGAIWPVAALIVPTVAFPFLLRRGVSQEVLGGILVVLVQGGLAWSAIMDRGVDDVAFLWIVASPLFATLVGGARLAVLSVGTAIVGAVAVLLLSESGHVFPDMMTPEFARRYHIANVIAAASVVATFAWLYEGPVLARARALADRLGVANEALQCELVARREAQAEAEAASRAKDVLLANVSHEFRTPLTAILAGIEILEAEATGEDREVLGTIDRGARRLLNTLSGVLDLMEAESRPAPPLAPVDVSEVAHQSVAAARRAGREKGLRVVINDVVPAEATAARAPLRQYLDLVLDNAVRFTERGTIIVTVSPVPEGVALSVTDTGIGMEPWFVARALEPFAQASEGDARTHEGLGLGLTLANRMARSMGGEMVIESAVGEGTTVRLVLPAADGPADSPPAAPAPEREWTDREAVGPAADPAVAPRTPEPAV